MDDFKKKAYDNLGVDGSGHLIYLAPTLVNLSLTQERWPEITFSATREVQAKGLIQVNSRKTKFSKSGYT